MKRKFISQRMFVIKTWQRGLLVNSVVIDGERDEHGRRPHSPYPVVSLERHFMRLSSA